MASRANIAVKELKILCLQSGGICAFPGCGERLVQDGHGDCESVIIGEAAHIVADSRQGPRGAEPLDDDQRSQHTNLILLCGKHHTIVDSLPQVYSVPVLQQMKVDHEATVRSEKSDPAPAIEPRLHAEQIHASLLRVTYLPRFVFAAPTKLRDRERDRAKTLISYPADPGELCPFVLRDKKLYAFHNLSGADNPFAPVLGKGQIERLEAIDLWRDADGLRLYVNLLNRAMYKFAGRRGLRYDPDHHRYGFILDDGETERAVSYRSRTGRKSERKVVWRPTSNRTGEPRDFYWHLAAALSFKRVGECVWAFSIRPERFLTSDGKTPLRPDRVGSWVTSLKSRMYNDPYLSEVHFWRHYLADGEPRFILPFGSQSVVVDSELLSFDMQWPEIPDKDVAFQNPVGEDDLFTTRELERAIEGEETIWSEEEEWAEAED